MNFLGRAREIKELDAAVNRNRASLVLCRGRRRIGKSRLLQEYGRKFPQFYEIQSMAPREGMRTEDQLEHFGKALALQTGLPALRLRSWEEAFALLANQTQRGKTFILLDEISWMAIGCRDFPGILKEAWDTQFKKNSHLTLAICGSVSSWIDQNILRSTGFVGRIALDLKVEELPLPDCHAFWGKRRERISAMDKFKLLAITGGVPRYLEEIDPAKTPEQEIKRLCFTPSGILFSEFEHIFNDIFQRRASTYKKIVKALANGKRSFSEICETIKVSPNGAITGYLEDLEESGFIAQDLAYSLKSGKAGRLSQYRIRDNYLRFYLRYIEPQHEKIAQGLYEFSALDRLPNYEAILGFQLENLVLNHLSSLLEHLGISPENVISASPYFQRKTQRQAACQVDLLIHTRYSVYVGEIKFRQLIDKAVISEVQEKVQRLKLPKQQSVRPFLIHVGELTAGVESADFFDRILPLSELLGA